LGILDEGRRGVSLIGFQAGMMALVSGAGGVTWNPADKSADVTLSAANLTMTRSTAGSAWSTARATTSKASGKWYFEVRVDTAVADMMIGIAPSSLVLTNYPGSDTTSFGFYSLNGNKYNNSIGAAYGASYTTADVIGVAYDATAGKVWFSKNNVWIASGDPATGINPAYTGVAASMFPASGIYEGGSAAALTGRFKAASITGTIPTGFASWE
jgi:hypothetical protein